MRAFRESRHNLHSLLVERAGTLVAERYRSGVDGKRLHLFDRQVDFGPTTLHRMRSVSKSIFGLLWGIAEGEGHVPSVRTPALDLLPRLADLRTAGRERITIEDLLAMRSGLAWTEDAAHGRFDNDENGLLWRADIPRYVFDRPLAAPAGHRFNYDSGHTEVLAQLLQDRTGSTLEDFARRRLFEPLGIEEWAWDTDFRGRPRASAGLRLTPRDLVRIGRMILDGGRLRDRPIVPGTWLAASFAPRLPAGDPQLGNGSNYGYHWWLGSVQVGNRRLGFHAAVGDGGQQLLMVKDLDLIVLFTAGEYGNPGVGAELHRIFTLVAQAAVGHPATGATR